MNSPHQSLLSVRLVETETGLRVHRSDVDAAIAAVLFVNGAEAYRGSHRSEALRGLTYCTVLLRDDGHACVGVSTDRESALRHAMHNAERRLRWMHRRALRLAASEGAVVSDANATREDAAKAVGSMASAFECTDQQELAPVEKAAAKNVHNPESAGLAGDVANSAISTGMSGGLVSCLANVWRRSARAALAPRR